jgi:hypothetical protein
LPKMEKTPDDVADAFDRALPEDPRVERRKMFGFPAGFVGGSMFAGTYGPDVVVKLGPDGQGLEPFVPSPGRPMTGFYMAPKEPGALASQVRKAFDYVSALPPKAAKPKAKKAAKK